MEDEDYKLFYYPFQVDDVNLVLCGFIKTDIYQARLRNIPVTFIYPLVVCFLLLLIFLPVIKFYLMGVNEQVKFSQLDLFCALHICWQFITDLNDNPGAADAWRRCQGRKRPP